jgi:hypothetical protein
VRIRIPIGPGASPLPGGNENHTEQIYPVAILSLVVGGGY